MRGNGLETWKPVPGYEGWYAASDQGRIKSVARRVFHPTSSLLTIKERILCQIETPQGYRSVRLSKDGKSTAYQVHRLVMLAFEGEPPHDEEVCHNNGDRADNRLSNLRYATRSENMSDAVRHGTHNHARKTHCKRGHEFTAANTRIERGGKVRRCRACETARCSRRASQARERKELQNA